MPTTPGWPSTIYPPQSKAAIGKDVTIANSYVQPLTPMQGGQLVASGAAFNFTYNQPVILVYLFLDVPAGVTCDVFVDGVPVLSVGDNQGLDVVLPYGNLESAVGTAMRSFQITGTNLATAARDVRAWGVCLR